MKLINMLLISLLITGCSVTGIELRKKPSGIVEYLIKENYKTVYRRIVQGSKRCFESGERRIDSNLFDDNNTGEITLALLHGGVIRALYTIDLSSVNQNTTKVKGYYSYNINNSWKYGAEESKEWASGDLGKCRYKSS